MKRWFILAGMVALFPFVVEAQDVQTCEQKLTQLQKELAQIQSTVQLVVMPRWFNDMKQLVVLNEKAQAPVSPPQEKEAK